MIIRTNYIRKQVVAMLGSGFYQAGLMGTWGLSAVNLGKVTDNANLTSERQILNPDQFSWYASLPLLLAIPGSFLGGVLTEYFGLRKFQLIMAPFISITIITMRIATWNFLQIDEWDSTMILIIRTVQSLLVGTAISVVCQYPCEIADSQTRGTLGGLQEFWTATGFALCYLLGYILHWTTVIWMLPLLTFLPGFLFLLISPESPVWLHRKGKWSESFQVLESLRCSKQTVEEEIAKMDAEEVKVIDFKQFLHLMKMKSNFKPQVISCIVIIFQVLTGILTISIFMVDIINVAGLDLHPNLSSFSVGFIRSCGTFIGAILLNYFSRKRILIFGTIMVALSNFLLGVSYLILGYNLEFPYVNWFPLIMLIAFVLSFSLGFGPSVWLVAAEILPNDIRSIGWGIVFTVYSLTAFIFLKIFPLLQGLIGMHGTFWLYSVCSFLFAFFVMFFVPETKGLSLKEIETHWK